MKSCKKHISTTNTKYPCQCQWLCVMREFRQKHEDKCKTEELPGPSWKSHDFMTGSSYHGGWQEGAMHGFGEYTFPNGVIYEGEFREGAFHGKGELRYQTRTGKVVIRGQWDKGVMTESVFLFDGDLKYDPKNWKYCKMPDRRFNREYSDGVQPGGKSFMTGYEPSLDVPEGYYDTGDGFFDIAKKIIYEYYDTTKTRGAAESVRRGPGIAEQRWIQKNCRVGKKDLIIGPQEDLYEKYMEPTALLEPVPPPAAKCMPTRKESTFELSEDLKNAPVFYDVSKLGADARPPERKFKSAPTQKK